MPRNSFHFAPGVTGREVYVDGELFSLVGVKRHDHVLSKGVYCVSKFVGLDVDVDCVVKLKGNVTPRVEIVIYVDECTVKEISNSALGDEGIGTSKKRVSPAVKEAMLSSKEVCKDSSSLEFILDALVPKMELWSTCVVTIKICFSLFSCNT